MKHRIILAGATGAIGRRLVPLLVDTGHVVIGTTRAADKASLLRAMGADAVVVDVFDVAALAQALRQARPDLVIHQLTDLPPALDPARMADAVHRNARIRREGTRNLVAAAVAAGVPRMIAQSIAWAYAPGLEPHDEEAPLDAAAEGIRAVSIGGVVALEEAVLHTAGLDGVVLRYGQLYGPGTGRDAPEGGSPLHVDAAAFAALCAIDHARSGIFNIAEANDHVTTEKARALLRWDSSFRLGPRTRIAAFG